MQELKTKKYWIWLSLIQDIGNRNKYKLLEKYQTPERIFYLTRKEKEELGKIGEKLIKNQQETKIKEVENHISYFKKHNISLITLKDEEYPKILKEIYDPPVTFYAKGNLEILKQKAIAIVGCREATEYGKNAAKYFGYQLAKKRINIVSGLAKGVDSYAHIGTIYAQFEKDKIKNSKKIVDNEFYLGKPIAVVGTGLDRTYPKENKELEKMILEVGGVILSEYPVGTKPEKRNFPARNRIISGLSKGVLVVEAKEKSGTLITVDFALEQGRDVYVVPGNINSVNSVGTNDLIKQGAKLVTNYQEIEI